jgi:hypothetical protein
MLTEGADAEAELAAVVTLGAQGVSTRDIARRLGLGKTKVAKLLQAHCPNRPLPPRSRRKPKPIAAPMPGQAASEPESPAEPAEGTENPENLALQALNGQAGTNLALRTDNGLQGQPAPNNGHVADAACISSPDQAESRHSLAAGQRPVGVKCVTCRRQKWWSPPRRSGQPMRQWTCQACWPCWPPLGWSAEKVGF